MSFWQKLKLTIKKWLPARQEELEKQKEQKDIASDRLDSDVPIPDLIKNEAVQVPPPMRPIPTGRAYQVLERFYDSKYWGWTERIRGYQDRLTQEKFIPENECKDEEITRYFGSPQPSSYHVLLHYLPAPKKLHQNPVLLVHGASHNANLSWCQSLQQEKGLVYSLSASGREVFAVTFAHSHGDNWQQAIQLSNVIRRIKEVVHADKIDLIAHSKGGVPVWMYLADLCRPWDAGYGGEVEKYMMLGTPNRGLDFPFRHVSPNWSVIRMGINAPIACDSMMYYGLYIDTTERSIYRDGAFPGSSQLLYRWDDKYPVQVPSKTLYYGGQNLFLHSRGIDAAIDDGGHLMDKLLSSPIDSDIEVQILAGNQPFFNGIPGEQDGLSDGLVFVDSVQFADGIARSPDQVKRKDVLPLNHLELLYHPDAHQWVLDGFLP
ncbi:alpha/beta fold hydrolase [Aneurinibacillus sp. Ricciae_BoGa-3]|uniref:esterase/lipase family protein n=1 Tax=Aneurinibacillus sp. Ricciae_BoGa-3 TaxID=3022697 RepID=UPI00233FFE0F|nr:alpha/beta fold hydrolase [Aneurinibacillus sp. Ricciae_BoGa-3]WCK54241.1 alpha/beta fold hydrolase [Aneurinibacillus sp. Ricciae_BoGa-3]